MSTETGFTPIENDLFSDEGIEVYDFEDTPIEPSGGGRFSDEPAPEPVKAGPTAKQTAKMMVTLYNSVLSRMAALWANDGRPPKDYSLEQDEKAELETAGEAYFETTKAEISPGWILLVSLLIISFSVIARAHKNRKAAIEAREQLAAAQKERAAKDAARKAELSAAAAQLSDALERTTPETYGPKAPEWRPPASFVESVFTKPADTAEDRKKFQIDSNGFYHYGHVTNDPAGKEYRTKDKTTWIKAPDKVAIYVANERKNGVKQNEINQKILELELWK